MVSIECIDNECVWCLFFFLKVNVMVQGEYIKCVARYFILSCYVHAINYYMAEMSRL